MDAGQSAYFVDNFTNHGSFPHAPHSACVSMDLGVAHALHALKIEELQSRLTTMMHLLQTPAVADGAEPLLAPARCLLNGMLLSMAEAPRQAPLHLAQKARNVQPSRQQSSLAPAP